MMNLLPDAASAHAGGIDQIIVIVHWLMAILFVGWGAFFIYVLVRFRQGRNPRADYVGVKSKLSTWLEVAVAVVEAVLLIGFAVPIWAERVDQRPPDEEATVVRVVAQQFAWNIWYPGADGVFGDQDIMLVDEEAVETAVVMLVELQNLVAEGAGATPLAALLKEEMRSRFWGRKVGLVITGGNIDVRLLSWVLTRGLVRDRRIVRLRIDIVDRPGVLAQVAGSIGACGGNIIEVYHQRLFYDVPAKEAEVDAVVETRNAAHVDEIVAHLRANGFRTQVLSARAADPVAI